MRMGPSWPCPHDLRLTPIELVPLHRMVPEVKSLSGLCRLGGERADEPLCSWRKSSCMGGKRFALGKASRVSVMPGPPNPPHQVVALKTRGAAPHTGWGPKRGLSLQREAGDSHREYTCGTTVRCQGSPARTRRGAAIKLEVRVNGF